MHMLKAKNVLTCVCGPKATANVTESQYMQEEGFTGTGIQFICKFSSSSQTGISAFLYLFVLEIPCLLLDQAVLVDLDDQNFLVGLLIL